MKLGIFFILLAITNCVIVVFLAASTLYLKKEIQSLETEKAIANSWFDSCQEKDTKEAKSFLYPEK